MIRANEATTLPQSFGPAALQKELTRLGWTQTEAAEYLRISDRQMRRYIAGDTDIPFPHFALLRLTRSK